LTDEIKTQLGLPQETAFQEVMPKLAAAVAWADQPGGVGGPETAAALGLAEAGAAGPRDLIRNLNRDVDRLMMTADHTAHYLADINDGLAGAGSVLAATPTILPLSRGSISSKFGARRSPFGGRTADFHRGLDIPAPIGTVIRAPADGTVLACGQSGGGYGLLLTIDHGYGLVTRYGHLDSALVEAGQTVTRGLPVARSGNSGRSTGPHLHYEVVLGGVPIDPLKLLAAVSPAMFKEIKILDEAESGAPTAGP
jgi:murein DD-endopeptidase MepM/ murein hydrolase activator NlpD